MIVNTKTGELKLTKRERDALQTSLNILAQVEKHGKERAAHCAGKASMCVGEMLEELTPVETAAV